MNKYIEVLNKILYLLPTIEEGLNHIKLQISELRYEESLELLKDVMSGISAIEKSLEPIEKFSRDEIIKLTEDLKMYTLGVIENYDTENKEILQSKIEKEILPTFINWKQALEDALKPYTLS